MQEEKSFSSKYLHVHLSLCTSWTQWVKATLKNAIIIVVSKEISWISIFSKNGNWKEKCFRKLPFLLSNESFYKAITTLCKRGVNSTRNGKTKFVVKLFSCLDRYKSWLVHHEESPELLTFVRPHSKPSSPEQIHWRCFWIDWNMRSTLDTLNAVSKIWYLRCLHCRLRNNSFCR